MNKQDRLKKQEYCREVLGKRCGFCDAKFCELNLDHKKYLREQKLQREADKHEQR